MLRRAVLERIRRQFAATGASFSPVMVMVTVAVDDGIRAIRHRVGEACRSQLRPPSGSQTLRSDRS